MSVLILPSRQYISEESSLNFKWRGDKKTRGWLDGVIEGEYRDVWSEDHLPLLYKTFSKISTA